MCIAGYIFWFNTFLNTGSIVSTKSQDGHRNILQELEVIIFFIPR